MHPFLETLRKYAESNVNTLLLLSIAFGFFVPFLDSTPNWVVTLCLAGVMFCSCAKITIESVKELRLQTPAWFYLIRYLAVPALLFWILSPISLPLAAAVLLITLAPSGVAAPAITELVGGSVVFSLFMTAATNLLFVLVAPFFLSAILGKSVPIDATSLFMNLLCVIVVPILLFRLVQWKTPSAVARIKKACPSVSVALICLMIVIIVARLRSLLLADPSTLALDFALIFAAYSANYLLFGWALGFRETRITRNAMAVASGVNNIALVIVISVLYFSAEVQRLMIMGEIVWIAAIPVYRAVLSRIG